MGEQPNFFSPELKAQDKTDLLLRKIVRSENEVVDLRSKANYVANLFDEYTLRRDGLYNPDKPIDSRANRKFVELDRNFRAEYEQTETIPEHFYLFMDKRYYPYLRSLDLGKTREAHKLAKLVELQDQYRALRDGLINAGVIAGELPRESADREKSRGREIHFRPAAEVYQGEDASNWSVGVRNRPLIRFEHGGYEVELAKRMTFVVPIEMALYMTQRHDDDYSFNQDARNITLPDRMAKMERLLDLNDERITRVRTLYFVKKKPIKA